MKRFQWLRDVRARSSVVARAQGSRLAMVWVGRSGDWDKLTWRADVLGRRLVSWLSYSGLLLAEADRASAEVILGSLSEQARHLGRVVTGGPDGSPRITAIKGLIYAA